MQQLRDRPHPRSRRLLAWRWRAGAPALAPWVTVADTPEAPPQLVTLQAEWPDVRR